MNCESWSTPGLQVGVPLEAVTVDALDTVVPDGVVAVVAIPVTDLPPTEELRVVRQEHAELIRVGKPAHAIA